MYEVKSKTEYRPFDEELNKNTSDWKLYNTTVRDNGFGLKEIVMSLDDAVLSGTSDSIDYMDRTMTRL